MRHIFISSLIYLALFTFEISYESSAFIQMFLYIAEAEALLSIFSIYRLENSSDSNANIWWYM